MIKATIFVAACLLGTSSLFAQQQKKEKSGNEFSSEFKTENPKMTSSQPVQSTAKAERSEQQLIMQPVGSNEKTEQAGKQVIAQPVGSTVKSAPAARTKKENTTEK